MSDIIIPTNPADIKTINDAVKEGCDCKLRMDSERTLLKEIIDAVAEKTGIKPKYIRKLINTAHKGTFDQDTQESEDFSALYETVIK